MEEIIFEVTPTPGDYANTIREVGANNKATWVATGLIGIPVFTMFFIMLLQSSIYAFTHRDSSLLPSLIYLMVIIFVAVLIVTSPIRNKMKAAKNIHLLKKVKYVLDSNGIKIITDDSEVKHNWSVFQKVYESKGYYYLVFNANKNMFQFIPKRAFQNKERDDLFSDLISKSIDDTQIIDKGIKGWALAFLVSLPVFLCTLATFMYMTSRAN